MKREVLLDNARAAIDGLIDIGVNPDVLTRIGWMLEQQVQGKEKKDMKRTVSFKVDPTTSTILDCVGNVSDYLRKTVQDRDRAWREQLHSLQEEGWTIDKIVEACAAQDTDGPAGDIVRELWNGNVALEQELGI